MEQTECSETLAFRIQTPETTKKKTYDEFDFSNFEAQMQNLFAETYKGRR
jgi:hypothetical protein